MAKVSMSKKEVQVVKTVSMVNVELTEDEASALYTLLYSGTAANALRLMGLNPLMNELLGKVQAFPFSFTGTAHGNPN